DCIRRGPEEVDLLFIDCWSGGGAGVKWLVAVGLEVFALLPDDLAVACVFTDGVWFAGCFIGAGEENLLAPKHGRRVPDTRQGRLPVVVGRRDRCGNGRRLADPGAVGAPETGPILGIAWLKANQQQAERPNDSNYCS